MKNNRLFKNLLGLSIIAAMGFFFSSCGDDTTPPTLKISINRVNGFTVDIGAKASSDVVSWHWEYGDGVTSDSVGGHSYTYAESGDYTIKCTVTNADGLTAEATEDVKIATIEELLTNGSEKTWKVASVASSIDGIGFTINENLTNSMPITGDLMKDILNLPSETDNLFTFKADGTLTINNGNGNLPVFWVYGAISGYDPIEKSNYDLIWVVKEAAPKVATWKLTKNTSLKLNVVDADIVNSPDNGGTLNTVTLNDKNVLTLKNGGFLGFNDIPTSDEDQYILIRNISNTELTITIFAHLYIGDPLTDGQM
jgi:hypothetical protein